MLRAGARGDVPRDPDDPYVRAISPGKVTAPLVGGCLWLLIQTMGTPWEIELEGAILFFEDVKLPPYFLDGFLTQLRHAGKLERVAGVVVGEMKDCDYGDHARVLRVAALAHARGRARAAPGAARGARALQAAPRTREAPRFPSARGSLYARRGQAEPERGRARVQGSKPGGRTGEEDLGGVVPVGVLAAGVRPDRARAAAEEGGTFRLGTSSRIDSLNPYVAFNQDAYSTFEYIYPTLIQYDKANAKFVPDFAEVVDDLRRRQDLDVQDRRTARSGRTASR